MTKHACRSTLAAATQLCRVLVILLFVPVVAHGLDLTLTHGQRAQFRDNTTNDAMDSAIVTFAKDPAVAAPLASPLCGASSSVRLVSQKSGGGLTDTREIALDCARWSQTHTGYRYVDRTAARGGVKAVLYKPGYVKISLKGTGYSALGTITGPVDFAEVKLTIAGTSYCGRFATPLRNLGTNVRLSGPTGACAVATGPPSPTPRPSPPPGEMNTEDTISDQAQSTTIAFDGLAFVTGSFCAQTFYPPGKVADFFGFQYLRDNDPSNLGHNTEFTTLSADPVLAVLTEAQVETFVALAQQEQQLSDDYGYARFPLARAFRRLIDGEVPAGHAELSREAVKAYSAYLFSIDGEMSYLRAQAYASVLGSMDAGQKAVLDAMKGHGAADWQQPATEPGALRDHGAYSVQLRTYAGEMFAWYAGNIDSDVYFCPERQGTYFGSFFMKDIKAMHNPNYTIDSNMTAEMGDAFLAALDSTQSAQITGLVTEQKQDLLAIVAKRDQIAATLRSFLSQGGAVDETTVVSLARQYGELDGEISYYYATSFAAVGRSLTADQLTTLTTLRKTATAEDDGSADYDDQCGNGYLYSAPLAAPPTVMNTDFMFGVCAPANIACSTDWDCCSFSCLDNACETPFTFTSTAFEDGGTLPVAYTCDDAGGGVSPPLQWTGAPEGTAEFALLMTTLALDGTKWNWVLFHVPANVTSLAQASVGVGVAGLSSDGPELRYYAPCSTGPGAKTYTFTLYALSAAPTFAVPEDQVNGEILTSAIAPLTIASRQLNVSYARSGL